MVREFCWKILWSAPTDFSLPYKFLVLYRPSTWHVSSANMLCWSKLSWVIMLSHHTESLLSHCAESYLNSGPSWQPPTQNPESPGALSPSLHPMLDSDMWILLSSFKNPSLPSKKVLFLDYTLSGGEGVGLACGQSQMDSLYHIWSLSTAKQDP